MAGTARADLVSQWLCDEGAGKTAFDSGPGGNDGTLFGQTGWTAGVSGSALEFFGLALPAVPGTMSVARDPSLDIASKISMTMWIRPRR
jgi:hypothetical protein